MKLFVKDRMVLMYIFNITSGNKMTFQDYMLKKEIMSKIVFGDEDIEKYGIENEKDGRMNWDIEKDRSNPLDLEIDEKTSSLLKKTVDMVSDGEHNADVWDVVQKVYDNC